MCGSSSILMRGSFQNWCRCGYSEASSLRYTCPSSSATCFGCRSGCRRSNFRGAFCSERSPASPSPSVSARPPRRSKTPACEMRSPGSRMNPSSQGGTAEIVPSRSPTIGMKWSLDRHCTATSRLISTLAARASIFCRKMFALFGKISWQRRAWFSHSDRTCGQKPARCEQLVSNSRISNPSTAVTASSPKSAGTLRREKVNICVPRHMHFEATSAKQLTASKNDRPAFAVERDYVTNTHIRRHLRWQAQQFSKNSPPLTACG